MGRNRGAKRYQGKPRHSPRPEAPVGATPRRPPRAAAPVDHDPLDDLQGTVTVLFDLIETPDSDT